MKRFLEILRSTFLWGMSWLHFLISVPILIGLAAVLDPRKHDWLQRDFCRRIVFLSGARLEVRRSPGFDPQRTSFFMVNHVNLFDPFFLYCAIPQFVRGWELESHFKIPAYGWLMKRFGNGGSIINLSSVVGIKVWAPRIAYGISLGPMQALKFPLVG